MRGNAGGRDWNGNGKKDSFDRFIDYKASSNNCNVTSNNKTNTQPSGQKDTPQNDGAVIFKSLLTVGLCIAGFVLPISADMGSFGTAICLLSAVAVGSLLWRK